MENEGQVEQWKAVVGAEGYEVSDGGRVRSLRYARTRKPGTAPKILSIQKKYGYSYVTLFGADGPKLRAVHRVVLEAFRGACPPRCEGCHNDGNVQNNRLENLRWDTHFNNLMDRVRHNTVPKGEKHANSKLRDADREAIRQLLKLGYPMTRIAWFFGLCTGTVRNTRNAGTEESGSASGDSQQLRANPGLQYKTPSE